MPSNDPVDALSALAPLFRVRPELQSLCQFASPWAAPHGSEAAGWAPFHLVTAGHCILDVDGDSPVALATGDIVLLPHGDAHVVRGIDLDPARQRRAIQVRVTSAIAIKSNTDDPEVELICGRLAFEQPQDNLAKAALPRIILIQNTDEPSVVRLRTILVAIRDEIEVAAPGARAICSDLASALMVMVLRIHFQRHAAEDGFLKLLGQRQTARALTALIADPARAWSLDAIAASANTSRATLVRDFRRLAKASPFDVLADIRLGIARHALCATDRPLSAIAEEVGYNSPSAFSRAFQRRFNRSPGDVRRNHARSATGSP
jgi:AraC family transcriptional activator of mtrCDE